MAGTKSRYSIGNILAAVLVMVVCGGVALYAMSGNASGGIGRNPEVFTAFGVVGVLIGAGIVVTGIRSRRR